MTKNSTKTMRYLSGLRERVMDWSKDSRLLGKHTESTSPEGPEKLSPAAKSLPVNLEWLTARARSSVALGAAAALALGAVVTGTAHQAQEEMQRAAAVSELRSDEASEETVEEPTEPAAESAEAPAEPAPEQPAESAEAPAEPAPEAPAPEQPAESGEAPADGQGSTVPVEEPVAEPVVEMPPASVPLDELRVTSPFGWRLNPLVSGAMEFHNGIDFGAVTGTPVKAAAAGTVTYAEYHQYGGLRIVVDHGDGTETTYNHLSGIYVEVGQHVDFNQVIGGIGSTGNSTGPHLHFEVIRHGEYIDPAVWLGL